MFVAALFSLALIQDPNAATGAQPQNQTVQTEEERAEAEREAHLNEVVCRREHVVGSNRPQRICQTRRQWDHLRDLSRQTLDESRFQTGQGRGPGESGI